MRLRAFRRVVADCKSGYPLVLFPIVVLRLCNGTASHVPRLELRVLQQQRDGVTAIALDPGDYTANAALVDGAGTERTTRVNINPFPSTAIPTCRLRSIFQLAPSLITSRGAKLSPTPHGGRQRCEILGGARN